MLDVGTIRRNAGDEDFAKEAEQWLDMNLVPRETNPVTADEIPAGKELNAENGGGTIDSAILNTASRIDSYVEETGSGMQGDMSIRSEDLSSFKFNDLGGYTLTVYVDRTTTISGLHDGNIVVSFLISSVSDGSPVLTLRDCTASVSISSATLVVGSGSHCAVLVERCSSVRFDGCSFSSELSSMTDKVAVVHNGSKVTFKSCSFASSSGSNSVTPTEGDCDGLGLVLEKKIGGISESSSTITSVSSKVNMLLCGVLKRGETSNGTKWELYGDRTNEYRGTLKMWRHGVSPSLYAKYNTNELYTPTSTDWDTNTNVQEIFDIRLPYSYSSSNYCVKTGVGNPVNLLGEGGGEYRFLILNTTTYEYYVSDSLYATRSTADSILIDVREIGDFKAYRSASDSRYIPSQTQKTPSRFFVGAHQEFDKTYTMGTFQKPIGKVEKLSSSEYRMYVAYDYKNGKSQYSLDFVTMGEISEESYNQIMGA